ncbi:MAG: polynucleotide adenylyltransferase PcnB [Spirochaetaceae bacterium]|nr:polynucleotide adenylyltransferase PcnB [Spirochaetaceae bacterium]
MRIRYSKSETGQTVRKAFVYTQNEHKINTAYVEDNAVYICSRLQEEGFETYIVGGAVRDLIMGKQPKDFDIASAASPSQIKKIFRNSRIIGRRFRLVHVFFGTKIFEVATFRSIKDGTAGNTFGTIDEDVLRRDFTLNALFYDPERQLVIDYVNGLQDILRKKLRPIIPLKIIFKDDPVRMLRAVKYSVLSGFPLNLFLRNKIKKEAHLLEGVSPSRLTEEINKIIHSKNVAGIIERLEYLGLYAYLQPNAHNLIKKSSSFKHEYFNTLRNLDKDENEQDGTGAKIQTKTIPRDIVCLKAMFYDYIDCTTDWKEEVAVLYESVFRNARNFVLPMNPQRKHIERAIIQIFSEHGVSVRKTRMLHQEMIKAKVKPRILTSNVSSKAEEGTSNPLRRKPHMHTKQETKDEK